MMKNVSTADRVVRIVVAATLCFLAATPALSGWPAYIALGFAAYLLLTAIFGSCIIYRALDVDSRDHGATYHSGEDPFDGRAGN
jgi:hypothetical protein